jgi:predicted nucleic acid-binding protein
VTLYVDSSVILRFVLGAPNAITEWIEEPNAIGSMLVGVEVLRTLDRLRITGELNEGEFQDRFRAARQILRRITLIDVTRSILLHASKPLPFPLKTLDAIHLATAIAWKRTRDAGTRLATHDRQLAHAATETGFSVLGA